MKLELSEEQIRIIAHGLSLTPYGVAASVVAEIQRQIDAAQKPELRAVKEAEAA